MRRLSKAGVFTSILRPCSTTSVSAPTAGSAVETPSPARPKPLFLIDRETHGFGGGVDPDLKKAQGSFDFFMKPEDEKPKKETKPKPGEPLPCDVPNSEAAAFAAKVGAIPKPKPAVDKARAAVAVEKPPVQQRSSLPKGPPGPAVSRPAPQKVQETPQETPPTSSAQPATPETKEELDAYYAKIKPMMEAPSKDQLWSTLRERRTQSESEGGTFQPGNEHATDVDYVRMDEEMKEHDLMRYRMASFFFRDETMRRKWCSLWNLAASLNTARWKYYEILNDKGTKSTGAAMRHMFWKEAIQEILDKGQMVRGQFIDGHPVLRPFAQTIQTTPGLTKTFIRGFVDARLKPQAQPSNMKQLCEYFDKFYGYFFNTLLEVIGVKNDVTEHIMMHVGRAIGITMHCVMFWKKYAALNMTMLPADLCADRYISLSLLRKTGLASRDKTLRTVLEELMSVVKTEMIHAHELASKAPVEAYPVIWECMYPNYHLGFLQRFDFNVSAMMGDHNIENPMYWWYCYKKQHQWIRKKSIADLLSEPAPLPFTNICIGHRGSVFKMPTESPQSSLNNPTPNQRKE